MAQKKLPHGLRFDHPSGQVIEVAHARPLAQGLDLVFEVAFGDLHREAATCRAGQDTD